MKQFVIRQASKKDLPDIQRLHVKLMRYEHDELSFCSNPHWPLTSLSRKYRKQNLRDTNAYLKVVTVNDKIIGFAQGWVGKSQPWRMSIMIGELALMYVESRYRAQGIGQVMMKDFILWAKTKKAKRLTLIVVSNNKRAIRLYEKNKYRPYFMHMERDI